MLQYLSLSVSLKSRLQKRAVLAGIFRFLCDNVGAIVFHLNQAATSLRGREIPNSLAAICIGDAALNCLDIIALYLSDRGVPHQPILFSSAE
jgi:hypothetical protein